MNNFKRLLNRENNVSALICLTVLLFVLGFYKICNILFAILVIEYLARLFKWGAKSLKREGLFVYILTIPLFLELIGLLWTSDVTHGLKSVETKALMFVLPMVMMPMEYFKIKYRWILVTFVVATLVALIVGLIDGFSIFMETGDTGYLYSDNITYATKKLAIYLSVYVNLAVVVTLYLNRKNHLKGWITITTLILLITFSFLLAARLSLLVLVAGLILYAIYEIRNKITLRIGSIIAIFSVVGLMAAIWVFPQTINRFKSVLSSFEYEFENRNPVNHFNAEVNEKNWNGLTIRLALWDCAVQQIKKAPLFGTGTGDYGKELMNIYHENNFYLALEREFGTHNQYLYTAVAFGAFGLLLLLGAYGIIFRRLYSKKLMVTLIAFTIILLACLTENFLNRLAGVFLYSLIISALCFTEIEERAESQALS